MTDKDIKQAEMFSNRITKKYRELKKWSRKNRITAFRLYDKDIPEIPLCLDLYEFLPEEVETPLDAARFISYQNQRYTENDPNVDKEAALRRYALVYLYERPYEKDEAEEEAWMNLMAEKICHCLHIDDSHVIRKMRKHQKGLNQYEKDETTQAIKGTVMECGELFKIDLGTYLDTGLFFDHRPLRNIVRDQASNKAVLNLFCYTGSFSVYAAGGNAKKVESVDLSNTYLGWARENMENNGFSEKGKYIFTRNDVFRFLDERKALIDEKKSEKFDIIILDPPTFSNSKMAENTLDINRQWPELCRKCIDLLNPKGVLYFSTNSKRLVFDEKLLPKATEDGFSIKVNDITEKTIDLDAQGTKPHKCFEIKITEKEIF